jgi:hypothetical protein
MNLDLEDVIELGKRIGLHVERIGDDEPSFLTIDEDTDLFAVWQAGARELDVLLALYREGDGPWRIMLRLASPCENPKCGERHKTGGRIRIEGGTREQHEKLADDLAASYGATFACPDPKCVACKVHKVVIDTRGHEAGDKLVAAVQAASVTKGTLH